MKAPLIRTPGSGPLSPFNDITCTEGTFLYVHRAYIVVADESHTFE